MAEPLAQESGIRVKIVKGRLGDMRVTLDGEELYASNEIPKARMVVETVRGLLPV